MSFDTLALPVPVLKAITDSGYTTPTPVQAASVPLIMAGHDLIASARTGTGKTAAFMLPALARLSQPSSQRRPRVLVLTPTRELAAQINEASRRYGRHLRLKSALVLGGMPYGPQLRALRGPLDLLVATPGRLCDHLERERVDLSGVELLVLDEADRMLDLGFADDVERISAATPAARQTLLFTATWNGNLERLAGRLLRDPKKVAIDAPSAPQPHIEQRLHRADDRGHKDRLLDHLVSDTDLTKAIIFTATKRDCEDLAHSLRDQGHPAAALHGDMPQRARDRTLTQLRSGRLRLLVATDVAARGIDIRDLSHVINYDLPRSAEDYIHRIGRTGRAGATGIAVSFAAPADGRILSRIQHYTGGALSEHVVPGLEPVRRPYRDRPRRDGAPRRNGPRGNGPRKEGPRFDGPRGGKRAFDGAPGRKSFGEGGRRSSGRT